MNIDTLRKSIMLLMEVMEVMGVNDLDLVSLFIILAGVIVITGISKLIHDTKKFIACFNALIRIERRSSTTNSLFIYERRQKPDSRIPFYVSTNIYIFCFVVFIVIYILTSPFSR